MAALVAQRLKRLPPCGRPRFNPWVGKIPRRRKWQSTPVFLPGESHGRRSLVGYSPRGRKELDTTERLHLHLLFCNREQGSCQSIISQKCQKVDTYTLHFYTLHSWASQGALVVKNPPSRAGDMRDPWLGKTPWRKAQQPTLVSLPGGSHGQRSLKGQSPWCLKESDPTGALSTCTRALGRHH